mmetsp:Transcript_22549/g.64051  ORF Transcript_22549/g.64051 Transcript_22549/m.64051 type:complete len:240 (-) Transcript_22549:1001-1720(-)
MHGHPSRQPVDQDGVQREACRIWLHGCDARVLGALCIGQVAAVDAVPAPGLRPRERQAREARGSSHCCGYWLRARWAGGGALPGIHAPGNGLRSPVGARLCRLGGEAALRGRRGHPPAHDRVPVLEESRGAVPQARGAACLNQLHGQPVRRRRHALDRDQHVFAVYQHPEEHKVVSRPPLHSPPADAPGTRRIRDLGPVRRAHRTGEVRLLRDRGAAALQLDPLVRLRHGGQLPVGARL